MNEAGRIVSPSARFLQYRITLERRRTGGSPELRELELAYMAKNVAPALDESRNHAVELPVSRADTLGDRDEHHQLCRRWGSGNERPGHRSPSRDSPPARR